MLGNLLEASQHGPSETRVLDRVAVEVGIARHAIEVGVVGMRRRSGSSAAPRNLVVGAEPRGVVSTDTWHFEN